METRRGQYEPLDQDSLNGLFIVPASQLDLVRERNATRNWGFSESDFTSLGKPPEWPQDKLSAVVLDVSLGTVQVTFEEAWSLAASVQPGNWRWDEVKSGRAHLRLLPGIAHECGLRWRVVYLAENWDKENAVRPADTRNPKTSPHSAILWAASYFPKWIRAMDGENVPYVWIPGYQLTIPERGPWSHVPCVTWSHVQRKVGLFSSAARGRNRYWAVPTGRDKSTFTE